ncbi:hypothetical protein IQ07DRAFT_388053 [Pyrenochaeta sp. DS3sAY3a]|nr:hypothetical protein IQ07DRAFT_388053 [Pyrenochaeta sp. DS3sAY3a]
MTSSGCATKSNVWSAITRPVIHSSAPWNRSSFGILLHMQGTLGRPLTTQHKYSTMPPTYASASSVNSRGIWGQVGFPNFFILALVACCLVLPPGKVPQGSTTFVSSASF